MMKKNLQLSRLHQFTKKGLLCGLMLLLWNAAFAQNEFITTWQTDNPGTSNATSITISVNNALTYNYDVDWDNDGVFDQMGITGIVTHDFGTAGTKTIRIQGTFPAIRFGGGGDRQKILSVDQWGNVAWESMNSSFQGCTNLTLTATDSPDLSGVTDMSYMFRQAHAFNSNIDSWDVSNVTNMESTFWEATSFNQDLDNWDVSNVTNMFRMFRQATAFNGSLNGWGTKTSSVTNMSEMFFFAPSFNQDLDNWDVSSVTHMQFMFLAAGSFNSQLNGWGTTTSNVQNMTQMFSQNGSFNQDISGWDVSSVTTMQSMFQQATAFNQDLDNWDVSSVTNMQSMFQQATAFNGALDGWGTTTGNVQNMVLMFRQATSFNQPLNNWDVSNVMNMESTFWEATSFNQNLDNWDVSNVTNMLRMFRQATAFNGSLNGWGTKTSSVTNMSEMYFLATSFNQDLGAWTISNVTTMFNILFGTSLSVQNYDNTLIGWAGQTVQPNVNLNDISARYCAGESARTSLMNDDGWIFGDNGKCCSAGTATADACSSFSNTVVAGGGWTDIKDASGSNTILAVDAPAGVDLGTVTVEFRPSSTIETQSSPAGIIKLLPRYYHISSSNYPNNAAFPAGVGIQLYFTDADLATMNAANSGMNGVTSHTAADIDITHYFGMNEDCQYGNNDGTSDLIGSPTYISNNCPGSGTEHILQFTVNHFSEFIPHEPAGSALPVDLVAFTGKNEGSINHLFWTTASEENNVGFELQRSNNGRDFETIGFVEGIGTTENTNNYSFIDERPLTGDNYYRLKQIDYDGQYELSNVIVLEFNTSANGVIKVFPNPNNGQFTLELMNPDQRKAHIELLDGIGRVIWSESFSDLEAEIVWQKRFDSLPKFEVYFLVAQIGTEIYSEKIYVIGDK